MITLDKVNGIYKKNTDVEVHAVKDVSLRLEANRSYAIMGASGAGKSTLLTMIGLLHQVTSGRYLLDGQEVQSLSESARTRLRAQRIGFVFQEFGLIEEATTLENVMAPLLLNHVRRGEAAAKARRMIEQLHIADLANRRVGLMSGGQRQRAAIARALVHAPSLLLCDEPTGALDTQTADQVMSALLANRPENSLILIVTHDARIASYCDETICMMDGQVVKGEK